LGPGPFMIAGAAALAIAMATVSAQSVKAALSDPVKAIRYE
jgi:putative ABC transport system permease protein